MRKAAVGWALGLSLAVACGEPPTPASERAVPQALGSSGSAEPPPAAERVDAADDGGRVPDGERGDATGASPMSPPTDRAASTRPSAPEAAPEPRPATLDLVFVGDVVLGEYVFDGHRSFAGPLAPGDPFADVAELLEADLVVGNLESPVMHEIPKESPLRYGHRFGASAPAVEGLAAGGFDVMSVANNHANDLGREGLVETPEVLRKVGITPVGEAQPEGSPLRVVTLEHRGWRIGFVSATTWLNHAPEPGDPKVPVVAVSRLKRTLVPLVEQARADHDLVIVLLHWGRERRERPEPAQVHAAHAFIDAGADLVIGHHPHVLQGIERYSNGIIAYSLGNFLFPAREDGFRDSAVLRVVVQVRSRCVEEGEVRAIRVGAAPRFSPRRATSAERRAIHRRMVTLGRFLRTSWTGSDADRVRSERSCEGPESETLRHDPPDGPRK